nr:RNA-directed DNA polymerase, eukaryota, reverse transcriptase zinc-binding domain protein [Tanacetum cinerariifolium]
MFLSQQKYALEILGRAGMLNCHPCRTPTDTESKLGAEGTQVFDPTLCRSRVGVLRYLTFTRPELSYVVQLIELVALPHGGLHPVSVFFSATTSPLGRLCAKRPCHILGVESVRYGVSKVLDAAYWGFLGVGSTHIYAVSSLMDTSYWLSKGSILVNESPTKEFQFHIGLFNGIKLDSSLQISHLFYADGAIFMGQCNIDTIIRVLDVFYCASGLRINMNKSNIMGISVDSNKVKHVAAKIGCLVLKMHFNYLGSRVGDLMSRVTEGMHTRSYEGASKYGIYSCAFFNGADVNSKKPSWVRWKSVIAAKDVGGLRVSSLSALNRALMFKWVWRFFSQKNSLCVRVVKTLHGEDEKIGKKVQPRYPSTWLNIINEIESLKLHGLEFSFRRNPRGGGEQAQFEMLKEMVEGVTLRRSIPLKIGVNGSHPSGSM